MGKPFLVADFKHGVLTGIFHKLFKAVIYCANKEGRIFVCKTTAGRDVSVGMNVENVAGALAVIFLEPAAGLPGAGVF